jgi:hypothetical protein
MNALKVFDIYQRTIYSAGLLFVTREKSLLKHIDTRYSQTLRSGE